MKVRVSGATPLLIATQPFAPRLNAMTLSPLSYQSATPVPATVS
nr:hypothetical protein [Microbispora corallina]